MFSLVIAEKELKVKNRCQSRVLLISRVFCWLTSHTIILLKCQWIANSEFFFIWNSYRFFVVYRDALVFRTSHYFISYMSVATLLLSGIEHRSNSNIVGYQVTRPLNIEFPRSLVSVVTHWNIPIHLWIKTCKSLTFSSFLNIKKSHR